MSIFRRLRRTLRAARYRDAREREECARPLSPNALNGGDQRWNVWDCQDCGEPNLYLEIDAGVTPFLTPCEATPGCNGRATSCFYPKGPVPDLPVRGTWRRATATEIRKMPRSLREHCERGGLILDRHLEPRNLLQ